MYKIMYDTRHNEPVISGAPRDPFPRARTTPPELAALEYIQTSPTPARVLRFALSAAQ